MIKKVWPVIRFSLFIILGLMSTVFIDPELEGSFENYLGYALLLLASIDIVQFVYKRIKIKDKTEV